MDGDSESAVPGWLFRLVNNLGVYFLFFALGYLALQRVRSRPAPDPSDQSFSSVIKRFLFFGPGAEELPTDELAADGAAVPKEAPTFSQTALKLVFCVVGLLSSFLSWGLLQERIMTTEYATGRFQSSNFMVFCSRSFGLMVAIAVVNFTEQPRLKAPFYQYSFTSLSNVMSSWCQLEALKYLSFPTQVLGKSSKMIPVMIMGKVISKKKYPYYEYGVAVVILFGVAMFILSENSEKAGSSEQETTAAGLFLLIGYLTFDSFTSQWQGHLFRQYEMSSYQMMVGVNTFSASLTLLSLIQTGELFSSISFLMNNPLCAEHIAAFAVCGATGSMFIFYTIKNFGPLVFTMIMVTRQLVAIVLSCIFYGHHIEASGIVGAVIVFSAIGYRIYRKENDRKQQEKSRKEIGSTKN